MDAESDDSDSDYVVEEFVRPLKIRKFPVNDDSADLLGNFDEAKRKKLMDPSIYNEGLESDNEEQNDEEANENEDDDSDGHEDSVPELETTERKSNNMLSQEQLQTLMRGSSKKNRHVIYVTNLNFETTKEDLENLFSQAGEVKGIRVPRKRRGGFAFVEMATFDGFQKAFEFHNVELQGRNIKVQISEGGKKKSANKKNILKQKNRKLAEMRNENKSFGKSGKNYDKNIKKEKAKELLARKRWRKKRPAPT